MAKLIQENEKLSLVLKQEILKNEEQENNLYSNGLAEILASSKEISTISKI